MATIKEMLETEHKRDRQDVIHLFGEGTFWRAYEQSAWLCVRSVSRAKGYPQNWEGLPERVNLLCSMESIFICGKLEVDRPVNPVSIELLNSIAYRTEMSFKKLVGSMVISKYQNFWGALLP